MLGRDFEDEVDDQIGYFGKMNSTLGSVVPLAMFFMTNPAISCFESAISMLLSGLGRYSLGDIQGLERAQKTKRSHKITALCCYRHFRNSQK